MRPWPRLRLPVFLTTLCGSLTFACLLTASLAQKALGSDSPLLIFDGTPANKAQLYLVNTGGLLYTAAPLQHDLDEACCAIWSPDGRQIAYLSYPFSGNHPDLYVAELQGTTVTRETRLTNTAANEFDQAWSPDGHQLVFDSDRDGNWEIYRIDLDSPLGPLLYRLTTNRVADIRPQWSPDGKQIAFLSNRGWTNELFIMEADGSHQHQITHQSVMWESNFSWSPDGQYLVFSGQHAGNRELYTVRADGSAVARLTFNLADDVNPLWSPRGDRIAFQTDRDGNNEIYLMNPDGSGLLNLTQNAAYDGGAVWSPDGTQLAFISMRAGNREVYVINADGTNLIRLTNNDRDDDRPAWRPSNQGQP